MTSSSEPSIQPTEQDPNAAFQGQKHTLPVEEHRRLSNDEIKVELCTFEDMSNVVSSLSNYM